MTFVKDYIQKVAGHLSDREFQLGMLFVVLLFLLCLLAMGLIRLRRRGRSTIVVSEEGGELVISRRAFADFALKVSLTFHDTETQGSSKPRGSRTPLIFRS